jgi:hypothetical protein
MRTPELEAEILRRLTEGESLRAICRTEGYPVPSAVIKWTNVDPDGFGEQYARACEARADVYFDALDDVSEDAVVADTPVKVAGLRLKADNITWQLARMAPKRYGDKVQIDANVKGQVEHTHGISDATGRLLADLSGVGADSQPAATVPD